MVTNCYGKRFADMTMRHMIVPPCSSLSPLKLCLLYYIEFVSPVVGLHAEEMLSERINFYIVCMFLDQIWKGII